MMRTYQGVVLLLVGAVTIHGQVLQCTEMINTCAVPAQNAVNRGERDVKQLCQLLQQLDSCVKNASRTTQCLATGTDQYALYRAHPAVKTPEVCARYTNVAARCRLCMDVLFGALLTAMLVCRWE